MTEQSILEEAFLYCQRLVDILPSPENRFNLALLLSGTGQHDKALELIEEIRGEGYSTRELLAQQAQLLSTLKRTRESAEVLEAAAERYQGDFELSLNAGIAWAHCGEPLRAIARLEALLTHPESGTDLLLNLGQLYLGQSSIDPSYAARAFDLFRTAFERDPGQPTLPARLIVAGQASGRTREAWDLVGRVDLTENPYLRAIPNTEAIPLYLESVRQDQEWARFYSAGAIPFAGYLQNAPRPAWFMWVARTKAFNRAWQSGRDVGPFLAQMPSVVWALGGQGSLPQHLILDMTAILTLGTLGFLREVTKAVRQAGCHLWLFPGCMAWLTREVARLQSDQLPWYRQRFTKIDRLLRESRDVVTFQTQATAPLEEARSALSWRALDIEHAAAAGGYYLDDYVDADSQRHIPPGILLSSRDLLAALVEQGVVDTDDADRVRREYNDPFSGDGSQAQIDLQRPIVVAELALLSWYDSGLLERWVHGGEGWPRMIVGPRSLRELAEGVEEADHYRSSLECATATQASLADGVRRGDLRELAESDASDDEGTQLREVWRPALDLFRAASHLGDAAIWADDLFTQLVLDRRGLLPNDQKFRELEAGIRGRFGSLRVLGTEAVLEHLRQAGRIEGARNADLKAVLYRHGYRILLLRGVLRSWLERIPYSPTSAALPYRQLLRDLANVNSWFPAELDSPRLQLFARTAALAVISGLIAEVWSVEATILDDHARRELASKLVRIFEEVGAR